VRSPDLRSAATVGPAGSSQAAASFDAMAGAVLLVNGRVAKATVPGSIGPVVKAVAPVARPAAPRTAPRAIPVAEIVADRPSTRAGLAARTVVDPDELTGQADTPPGRSKAPCDFAGRNWGFD
jgi:hypothetical protein